MSQSSAKDVFKKPWLTYPEQVSLLQRRGLVIGDVATAEQFLSHLNY